MHLVDRDGLGERDRVRTPFVPLLVAGSSRGEFGDHGGRLRRHLRLLSVRVGLGAQLAGVREDLELVAAALTHVGDEELPDAARAERPHRMGVAVPEVEITHDVDAAGGGRPNGKGRSCDVLMDLRMGAEQVVDALVAALADQIQVELAERRQEHVRINATCVSWSP